MDEQKCIGWTHQELLPQVKRNTNVKKASKSDGCVQQDAHEQEFCTDTEKRSPVVENSMECDMDLEHK